MTRELEGFLDGEHVGAFRQSAQGAITFEYDEDYRRKPGATPMSLSMPLERATHKNRAARAFLQGLLPDSADRLRAIAAEHQVSGGNPFAILEHIGRDAAGAVQLLPPGRASDDGATRQGHVNWLSDSDFAALVSDVIANRETWGRRSPNIRWSLPGAQPKVALFQGLDGRWAIPLDSTPTTHIVKPAVPPYSSHHINEYMTMAAARRLGIRVANNSLTVTTAGDAAFVSERYDRELKGGRWSRLHQEDLCQALSYPSEQKYQSEGGPGVGAIASLFARLPDPSDRDVNARGFFDALVFNLAAQGTDAHAKNYSLMLNGDHATLAPLYDLGSHAPYPTPENTPLKLAMSVDGEFSMDAVGIEALVHTAHRLGLDEEHARHRADEITTRIVDAYRGAAEDARAVLGNEPFIGDMVGSIESYAKRRGWA